MTLRASLELIEEITARADALGQLLCAYPTPEIKELTAAFRAAPVEWLWRLTPKYREMTDDDQWAKLSSEAAIKLAREQPDRYELRALIQVML